MKQVRLFLLAALFIQLMNSCDKGQKKVVVCWGDSLSAPWNRPTFTHGRIQSITQGNDYPYYLQEMLGCDYDVINAAVSGENTLTIMGRQGAYPMLLAHDVTIIKNSKKKFKTIIGNNDSPAFLSSYNSQPVMPFIQGNWRPGSSSYINPCIINGKKYIISAESTYWPEDGVHKVAYNYYIEPLEEIDHSDTLKAGSVVETLGMQELKNKYANIFFMGGNGGFMSAKELIEQYDKMISYSQCSRYIDISFHMHLGAINTNKRLTELEDSLNAHYGRHFINLRKYLVKRGMEETGLTPTSEDEDSIANGSIPPQLLRDGKHFKGVVNRAIASLVHRKMKDLGY